MKDTNCLCFSSKHCCAVLSKRIRDRAVNYSSRKPLVLVIPAYSDKILVYRVLVHRFQFNKTLVYRVLVHRVQFYKTLIYRVLVHRVQFYKTLVYRSLISRILVYKIFVDRILLYRILAYRIISLCTKSSSTESSCT